MPLPASAISAAPREHLSREPSVVIAAEALDPRHFAAVARGRATFEFTPSDWQRIASSADTLAGVVRDRRLVYGITTGFGPLASHLIADADIPALQRNLVYHLASGVGRPLAWDEARGVVLSRLLVMRRGHSGAQLGLVRALLGVLATPFAPYIPEKGTVGASGDLTPLAHVALAIMGEGQFVTEAGQVVPAQTALAHHGLPPYRFGHRDALALVNGTSCMTGLATLNAADAELALAWSVALSAAHGELLGGRTEAWDPRFAELRGHPGQLRVTRWLQALSAEGEGFTRGRTADTRLDGANAAELATAPQDPYTVRCVPQLLGAVADVVAEHRRIVGIELDAVTDNPILVDEPPHALHGGNFFGQHVGFASDSLTAALIQQAVLAERQIARLVDIRQNGGRFPAFLQPDRIGLQSGFMGAQVTASALVAEMRTRAIPASIQSIPTNANNQDVVSMGTIAARNTRAVLSDLFRVQAIQMLCVAQAADIETASSRPCSSNMHRIHGFVRRLSAFLSADRPLGSDIDRIASEMQDGCDFPEIMT